MKLGSRQTALAVVLTLCVHALLWWLFAASPPQPGPPPAATRVSVMVLTANRREPQSAAPADATPSRAAAPARDRRAAQARFAPPAIPLADAAVDARPVGFSVEPAASQPVTGPLNLSLPRARGGRQAQPQSLLGEALDDPRTNTARASPGERMARVLGTDQRLIEEPLGGDRVRMRRGTDCVVVSRSRESELDPFNQSVNPSARGVTPCP